MIPQRVADGCAGFQIGAFIGQFIVVAEGFAATPRTDATRQMELLFRDVRPDGVNGVDERLKELIEEVCCENRIDVIEMEIMPDHVHLLMEVDPQFGLHKAVKLIKGGTIAKIN